MGHLRLGKLPQTKPWREVVALIDAEVDASGIAAATLRASDSGLDDAANDPGLIHTFWLLTQVPIAARDTQFGAALRRLGMDVSDEPEVFEIVAAYTEAIDKHLLNVGGRTDLGELAQLVGAEALAAFGHDRSRSLLGESPATVQRGFRELASGTQFAAVGQDFFARLVHRYLNSYLSRELSNHVGAARRFQTIEDHSAFDEALRRHCGETAIIVRDFAGDWFGKHAYRGGITERKVGAFLAIAIEKLRGELRRRGHVNG